MDRARRIACIVGFAALLPGVLYAQQPWSIGARAHYGYLWPHHSDMLILVEGHAGAAELFMEREVKGDRPWHRAYGNPRYGVAVIFTRLANPDHIGWCAGLMPYLTLPLLHGDHCSFGLRTAWGVGYVAKRFDRHDNTRQIAIGSRINTAIQLMPEVRYHIAGADVHAGIALDHWSNGSFKQPNLGLNFVSLSLGASIALGKGRVGPVPEGARGIDSTSFERPEREFLVVCSGGISEDGRPINGQRSVFVLSGEAGWRKGRKGSLACGVDIFNKGDLATTDDALNDAPRVALTQVGVQGGGSLLAGRGELLFRMGVYVITPAPDDAPVYQRFGVRYRCGKHLLAGVSLKTHFAAADHWEFGIGYRWD
ncbi:MAG: acyloxyacyl hydrolase [Flavobacteriales bacterium]|nr:acyloxyacyl hydrolase [Flavobacteriales bacterium]